MKKLIAILLTAALCLSLLPAAAFADNAAFIYNDAEIQDLYYDFEYVSDMVNWVSTMSDTYSKS